jgi:hypothetical protein
MNIKINKYNEIIQIMVTETNFNLEILISKRVKQTKTRNYQSFASDTKVQKRLEA